MLISIWPGRVLVLLCVAMLAAACQTVPRTADGLTPPTPGSTVLMMTPDVELYEMQASGILEPKTEWTKQAKTHVVAALNKQIQNSGAKIIQYRSPASLEREQAHHRLLSLHRAVGGAIRQHRVGILALPSKQGRLDWTLGPGVQALREEYDADYAFFLHVRDSYASAGRGAVVLAGILLGVPVAGGQQLGFVSLVDLRTGQVVWANQTFGGGDIRTPEPANKVVQDLLTEFPI